MIDQDEAAEFFGQCSICGYEAGIPADCAGHELTERGGNIYCDDCLRDAERERGSV